MKKALFLVVLCISITLYSFSQWKQISTGTQINLLDIFSKDSKVLYCVGGYDFRIEKLSDGIILKSVDGGNSWSTVFKDTILSLQKVVASKNRIYAFGNRRGNPIQMYSEDEGKTWTRPSNILEMKYIIADAKVFNDIIYITDLGTNFYRLEKGKLELLSEYVMCFDVNKKGILLLERNYELLKFSSDFGKNWSEIKVQQTMGIKQSFLTYVTLKFSGDSIAIVTTSPITYLFTTDFGNSWQYSNYIPATQKPYIITPDQIAGVDGNFACDVKEFGSKSIVDSIEGHAEINSILFTDTNHGFWCGKDGSIFINNNFQNSVGKHLKFQTGFEMEKTDVKNVFEIKLLNSSIVKYRIVNPDSAVILESTENKIDLRNNVPGDYYIEAETKRGLFRRKVTEK